MIHVPDRIAATRGNPAMFPLGNDPDFISQSMTEWEQIHAVRVGFIELGTLIKKHLLSTLTVHTALKYSIPMCQGR